ncbi:phosphatidylglycerophosphate synthase [Kineosphaera limosa]|uniref:Uncharacterized protein n=1 Tax=Kineosphaera limosa NBRC 100340 TaxID=1184609 RepID=K6WSP2_9MICO|nr:hypothetical protein [Kineosphaera limosa]NYE02980.1 phosphatidylglycerophosphate synthase [Kineosphaera limosa]GAB95127.1 hypothetical protein KILIM_016_00670 [Kineosphaera limosa NBRC 100340]
MDQRRATVGTYVIEGAWVVVGLVLLVAALLSTVAIAITVAAVLVISLLIARLVWMRVLRTQRAGDLGAPTAYAQRGGTPRTELMLAALAAVAFLAILFLRQDGAITTQGLLIGAILLIVVGAVRVMAFRQAVQIISGMQPGTGP